MAQNKNKELVMHVVDMDPEMLAFARSKILEAFENLS